MKIVFAPAGIDRRVCIIGNLDARRDWGHARDYVEAQWLMLQQDEPVDLVIATGKQYSVRDFVETAAERMGVQIEWSGSGAEEFGVVAWSENEELGFRSGDVVVQIDPRYYRPAEVETLLGDASLARETLGWTPRTSFRDLVDEMVAHDLRLAREETVIDRDRSGG